MGAQSSGKTWSCHVELECCEDVLMEKWVAQSRGLGAAAEMRSPGRAAGSPGVGSAPPSEGTWAWNKF